MMESKDYEPIGNVSVVIDGKCYAYDFTKLNFKQIMIAEEMGFIRERRLAAIESNPNIDLSDVEYDYKIKLASVLFVPTVGAVRIKYDRAQEPVIYKAMEDANQDQVEIIEACLIDFFTRRGRRLIASRTLKRNTAGVQMVEKFIQASRILQKNSENSQDYSTEEKSNAA